MGFKTKNPGALKEVGYCMEDPSKKIKSWEREMMAQSGKKIWEMRALEISGPGGGGTHL